MEHVAVHTNREASIHLNMDYCSMLERFVLCSEVLFDPVFMLWMKALPTGSLSCSSGRVEALTWVVRLVWPLNVYLNLFLKGTETNSITARAIFQRNPIESSPWASSTYQVLPGQFSSIHFP